MSRRSAEAAPQSSELYHKDVQGEEDGEHAGGRFHNELAADLHHIELVDVSEGESADDTRAQTRQEDKVSSAGCVRKARLHDRRRRLPANRGLVSSWGPRLEDRQETTGQANSLDDCPDDGGGEPLGEEHDQQEQQQPVVCKTAQEQHKVRDRKISIMAVCGLKHKRQRRKSHAASAYAPHTTHNDMLQTAEGDATLRLVQVLRHLAVLHRLERREREEPTTDTHAQGIRWMQTTRRRRLIAASLAARQQEPRDTHIVPGVVVEAQQRHREQEGRQRDALRRALCDMRTDVNSGQHTREAGEQRGS